MRPALVPGRWPAAVLAAVGVLLALPSLIWPVLVITYPLPEDATLDAAYSMAPFSQGIWGWGKYAQLGDLGPDMGFEMSNTLGLLILAGSLTLGAGAVAAWALLAGEPGRSLGIAGVAFAAAVQLALSAQWVGQRQSGSFGVDGDALSLIEQQAAGWLQLGSVAALAAALGFMLWSLGWVGVVPSWRRLTGSEREAPSVLADAGDEATAPPLLGSARLRGPGEIDRRARMVEGRTVGFSEDEPGSDDRPDRRVGPPA